MMRKKLGNRPQTGLGLNIVRTNDKIVRENIPNIIRPRQAVVVRVKKNIGLSEKCYIVLNDGKNIIIKSLEEANIVQNKDVINVVPRNYTN